MSAKDGSEQQDVITVRKPNHCCCTAGIHFYQGKIRNQTKFYALHLLCYISTGLFVYVGHLHKVQTVGRSLTSLLLVSSVCQRAAVQSGLGITRPSLRRRLAATLSPMIAV